MTPREALERALRSYEHYYTVLREDVTPPFQAEALFMQHDERYFLSRSIKLSESDAHEHVFFAALDALDAETFQRLDEAAWTEGLSRVKPEWGHRGADVTLVILAERIEGDAAERLRAASRSKGYCLSLKGWSNYRVIAMELSTGRTVSNRLGRQMVKTLDNIFQSKGIVT